MPSKSKNISAYSFQLKGDQLDLTDFIIGDSGVKEIAKYLKAHGDKVKHLNISGNNITSNGFSYLLKEIREFSSLKSIKAEWNYFGSNPECFECLINFISSNGNLNEISLQNNKIGSKSVPNLIKLIKANKTLSKLDLKWNEIDSHGAEMILNALKDCTTLTYFDISKNKIDYWILDNIQEVIERNKSMAAQNKYLEVKKGESDFPNKEKRDENSGLKQINSVSLEEIVRNERKAGEILKERMETEFEIEKSKRHKLEDIMIKLEGEMQKLSDSNSGLENQISKLQAQLQLKSEETTDLTQKLLDSESDAKKLKEELLQIYQYYNSEVQKANNSNENSLKSITQEYQSQIENLESTIKSLKSERKEMQESHSKLENIIGAIEKKFGIKVDDKLEIFEEGKTQFIKEINELKNKIREMEEIAFEKEKTIVSLREKEEVLEARIDELNEEFGSVKNAISGLEKNHSHQKSENTRLMSQYQIILNDLRCADEHIQDLEMQIQHSGDKWEREKEDMEANFRAKMENLSKERDFLKIRNTQLETMILDKEKELSRQITYFQKGIENLNENLQINKAGAFPLYSNKH